jgi:hypothetical protein
MANESYKEGQVAKTLEKQTARIPSDVYLWSAVATMGLSLGLFLTKNKHASMFFGQWAPSLLIIGLYNKIVKLEGHDQEDKGENDEKNRNLKRQRSFSTDAAI